MNERKICSSLKSLGLEGPCGFLPAWGILLFFYKKRTERNINIMRTQNTSRKQMSDPLMGLPTGCHYHFPLFRAMSFQCIPHRYSSNTCSTTVQPNVRRQPTRLPFPCHPEWKKTAPLPLQAGGKTMVTLAIKRLVYLAWLGFSNLTPRGNHSSSSFNTCCWCRHSPKC